MMHSSEVDMDDKKYCDNCKFCDYDEIYIRETGDEIRIYTCQKDKDRYIDQYTIACDEYKKH